MKLTSPRAIATTGTAIALAAVGLAASPAHASPATANTRPTAGCVGTIQVTNLETSAGLGRITQSGANATPTRNKSAWTSFKISKNQLNGSVGQLKVAGTKTALSALPGGAGEDPYYEMQPGTADNLIFSFVGPSSAPGRGNGAAEKIWKVNARNGRMRVIWTQPDSSLFPVKNGYQDRSSGGSNYLGTAVDFPVFDSAIGGNAIPVGYTFVPARGSSC